MEKIEIWVWHGARQGQTVERCWNGRVAERGQAEWTKRQATTIRQLNIWKVSQCQK